MWTLQCSVHYASALQFTLTYTSCDDLSGPSFTKLYEIDIQWRQNKIDIQWRQKYWNTSYSFNIVSISMKFHYVVNCDIIVSMANKLLNIHFHCGVNSKRIYDIDFRQWHWISKTDIECQVYFHHFLLQLYEYTVFFILETAITRLLTKLKSFIAVVIISEELFKFDHFHRHWISIS